MEPMGWGDYFIVLGCCAITMLVFRRLRSPRSSRTTF